MEKEPTKAERIPTLNEYIQNQEIMTEQLRKQLVEKDEKIAFLVKEIQKLNKANEVER